MNDLVEEGKAKAAGIVSILIAVFALIELICGFIYLSKGGPEGSGLWSGVGLVIIAILGIVTWIKKNKTVMVFYLVMCILWFIVMIVQVIIALIAWFIWHVIRRVVESECRQIGDTCHCDTSENTPITVHNCDDIKTIESIFLCIVIVGAFAAIFTLAGSIIGCMATCCARPQEANVVVVQQPGGYPMTIHQTTVSSQPGYGYPPQQSYPGAQPVGAYPPAGGGPPPDYGLPEKQ